MGTHPIFESDFDCLTAKCFGRAERFRFKLRVKSRTTESTTRACAGRQTSRLVGILTSKCSLILAFHPPHLSTKPAGGDLAAERRNSGEAREDARFFSMTNTKNSDTKICANSACFWCATKSSCLQITCAFTFRAK